MKMDRIHSGASDMAEFDRRIFILILTFWIFVPTLDMISDMTMVIRLFRGPSPNLVVSGGERSSTSVTQAAANLCFEGFCICVFL